MKSNFVSLSEFESKALDSKWFKVVPAPHKSKKPNTVLEVVQWCRTEIDGHWTGHMSEMWFESKEDQVKFALRWG